MKRIFKNICGSPVRGTNQPDKTCKAIRPDRLPVFILIAAGMLFSSVLETKAQTTYYSQGNLAVNLPSSWNTAAGGGGTEPADFNGTNTWIVQSGHNMTTSAAWTVGSGGSATVTIEGGLTVSSTFQVTITGTLTVNGTLTNSGTYTGSASPVTASSGITINGTYVHARNGGYLPTATWALASNCNITGVTTAAPTIPSATQPLGNFTWNCPSQSSGSIVDLSSQLTSVNGNFNLVSTGATNNYLNLGRESGSTLTIGGNYMQTGGTLGLGPRYTNSRTMNVNGDFTLQAGRFFISPTNGTGILNITGNFSSSAEFNFTFDDFQASATLNITGNCSITGGTFNMSRAASVGTLNLQGNFSHTSGTITETRGGFGSVVFNGTAVQTYTSGGTVSNNINFTVNEGAILQMAAENTTITGGGTFTLMSGATLGVTSANGITPEGTALGNIRTLYRSYGEGANYIYNGTSAQVTGTGLTSNIPANLTINNISGVTLSAQTTISGLLTMTSGTLNLANTNFTAGSLTGSSAITNSSGTASDITITIGSDNTSPAAYSGAISDGNASSVSLVKNGTGTLILSGTNAYSGTTTIVDGILELGSGTCIPAGSDLILNGGTLSTGSGTGFSESFGTLNLQSGSGISLGTGVHTLSFSASNGVIWGSGILNITGWAGDPGSGGDEGKLIVGTDGNGLSESQLSQILFGAYGAGILSDGEVIPLSLLPTIVISSPDPAVSEGDILQNSLNNVIYRFDIGVTVSTAVISGLTITTAGTYSGSDLINLKAWYSSDNTFSPETDILLSVKTESPGPGTHIFPSWTNQDIPTGTTGYIFISADLACTAVIDNEISVNGVTSSDVSFIGGSKSGSASAGEAQTIVYGMPGNASGLSASIEVSQTVLGWNNPDCFDEILIAAKETEQVTLQPSGDGLSYSADPNFGDGDAFDGGYLVYKGNSSPLTVTNLQNGTKYYFTLFSRRGTNWSAGATVSVIPFDITAIRFRSSGSGDWSSVSIWEMSYDDGSTWVPATVVPDNTYGSITVLNGHSVTVTGDLSIDETIIEAGATVSTGAALTIADGPDADCSVSGTVETTGSGSVISTGALEFADGGTYIHNRNGGSVPTATWATGSNCNITGITTSLEVSSLLQSFGNFTWNCPGQTSEINIEGNLRDIKGSFTVTSTGTQFNRMGGTGPVTLNIGGNYTHTDGLLTLTRTAAFTMNIAGNLTLTAPGRINMSVSSTAPGTIIVAGDFIHNGQYIGENSSNNPAGIIIFNGSGDEQTLDLGGELIGTLNFVVNTGAYLQMAQPSTAITGTGAFTLSSGATLGITSAAGITSGTTLSGNIQTTGGRIYSGEANYIYNGTGSQVSGDGLPLAVNSLGVAGTSDLTLTNGPSKSYPLVISDDLTISSDAGLAVGPAQAVTVGGNIINDGDLDLEADGTGMASLLINGSYSGAGNAKSEIFMTGGDAGSEMWRWHYFAVPSQQSPTSLAGVYGDDIMNYIDVTDMTDKSEGWNWYDGWDGTTPFANLDVSNGYAFYNDNDVTMEINNSSLLTSQGTVSLNYSTFGWNLIGNSLTCGLNWDLVTFTGQVDHSVSFIKDYVEYYYIQNGPGVPDGTSGHIPPLQGFFVQALATGASINFSDAKEHNTVAYYKGAGSKNDKGNDLSLIRLSLAKDESSDEMVVWFMEEATMGYDYRFDAEKWYSEGTRPQIYSVLTGREYAINGIPLPETTAEIPLGLWIPEAGSYTISLMELDNIGDYDIYMKDLVNNTKTKLDDSYRFTFTAPAGAVKGRFVIAMENRTTGTEEWKISENPFRVYGSFGFINIELQDEAWEGKQGSVRVVDLSGRTLIDSRDEIFSMTSLLRLPMESRKGIYIVEINSFPQRYVTRVVMK